MSSKFKRKYSRLPHLSQGQGSLFSSHLSPSANLCVAEQIYLALGLSCPTLLWTSTLQSEQRRLSLSNAVGGFSHFCSSWATDCPPQGRGDVAVILRVGKGMGEDVEQFRGASMGSWSQAGISSFSRQFQELRQQLRLSPSPWTTGCDLHPEDSKCSLCLSLLFR